MKREDGFTNTLKGQRSEAQDAVARCLHCGEEFVYQHIGMPGERRRSYCSQSCRVRASAGRRKRNKETLDKGTIAR